jgi:hypothetical protein
MMIVPNDRALKDGYLYSIPQKPGPAGRASIFSLDDVE